MTKIMDAYVRISRVGARDRDSEAYRSPAIQRQEIQRWAEREGVTIGKVAVDEDVSGGKAVAQRRLEGLIVRAERGDTGGVVTCWLDRFGRDHIENLLAVRRLKNAGARLVCVNDGVDSDQESGKLVINLKSIEAENYLERTTANWRLATSRAVGEGKHVACRAPLGYLRADIADPQYDAKGRLIRNARLVLDPEKAPAMTQAFAMRATGASLGEIVDAMPFRTVKSTMSSALMNRAYLGEARGPHGAIKVDAHEPLTTPEVFERCQPGRQIPRTGLTESALLGGHITCAGCGHKLRVLGSGTGNRRRAVYACHKHFSAGDCAAPAAAVAAKVDEFVALQLDDSWDDVERSANETDSAWLTAREDVRRAQEDLETWTSPEIQRTIAKDLWMKGIAERQAAVEAAQRALWELPEPDVDLDKPVVMIAGKPMIYEVWGDDIEADRRHLRRHIARVTLAKADPARRGWQPIAERVEITWR